MFHGRRRNHQVESPVPNAAAATLEFFAQPGASASDRRREGQDGDHGQEAVELVLGALRIGAAQGAKCSTKGTVEGSSAR